MAVGHGLGRDEYINALKISPILAIEIEFSKKSMIFKFRYPWKAICFQSHSTLYTAALTYSTTGPPGRREPRARQLVVPAGLPAVVPGLRRGPGQRVALPHPRLQQRRRSAVPNLSSMIIFSGLYIVF